MALLLLLKHALVSENACTLFCHYAVKFTFVLEISLPFLDDLLCKNTFFAIVANASCTQGCQIAWDFLLTLSLEMKFLLNAQQTVALTHEC